MIRTCLLETKRKIRITLALLFVVAITLLFLDFTGTIHGWLGWLAKIQFLPALLALNVGVVVVFVLLTSRCVACFNCIDKCNKKAITYTAKCKKTEAKTEDKTEVDSSRRQMLTVAGVLIASSAVKAQEKKADGGLAFIEDKKIPKRLTRIVPPGSGSIRNFSKRCTGCQLCVSVCPRVAISNRSGIERAESHFCFSVIYIQPSVNSLATDIEGTCTFVTSRVFNYLCSKY